jgi:outer membrane protein OmpA-like peptidoglycan-associated protein
MILMLLRLSLLAATFLTVPLVAGGQAWAQPVDGFYVGLGAGGNYLQPERVAPSPGLDLREKLLTTNIGGVGVASVGYGFGNGLRLEVEGDIRHDRIRQLTGFTGVTGATAAGGDQFTYGGMVNALFDMDIGRNWIYPYFGLGGGVAETSFDNFHVYGTSGSTLRIGETGSSTNFAYQGIFGLSFPLAAVPGLSLTTEYRFYGVLDSPTVHGTRNLPGFSYGNLDINNDYNHSLIVGVRYAFNTAPPAPPAPVAARPAAPAVARTYLVFFDWDRADLTDRARQIVAEAAAASTSVQTTRIDVQGNADRSGTPAYNQALSLRRARVVAAELVRHGVPQAAIEIQAFGDTRPLVPTGPGVREPQNRRVAIILH